jgi:tRNA-specific 2-thiouridylase
MSAPHVVVGLSGGVDSAVTAWLLREQGYRVSGLFMVNWTEDEAAYCSANEDFQSARAVCEELAIPLHRVDFSAEYRSRVFTRFLADYAAGKTPNPDVLCNREVKFQPFREHALRLGADCVATGHYARLRQGADGPQLLQARDGNKDQTYFLATVEPRQLEQVLFPIGEHLKPEVRELARRAGLPNHRRRDSTGICFIGERDLRAFLGRYLPLSPGPIEDESGALVGQHRGLTAYTLGQRRGLLIGGRRGARAGPWFVVGKDLARNALTVSQDADSPLLFSRRLRTEPFHWLQRPSAAGMLQARIRHRQALQDCVLQAEGPQGELDVEFSQAQRAVCAGQYLVLYQGEVCLGGGEIRASLSGP